MPDRRQHRGPHPEDHALFAPAGYPVLFAAFSDLCWLLDRGYALRSSLKLVGDRYQLAARQRLALERSVCTQQDLLRRRGRERSPESLACGNLHLDGYNVLTTIEAALSGGVLIRGRDGALRDMASMHGSYRKVRETALAVRLIGQSLAELQIRGVRWLLDKPVSNSGRLAKLIREIAGEKGWSWEVEIVPSPDFELMQSPDTVATADSVILDHCTSWVNLTHWIVSHHIPQAWVIDFSQVTDHHEGQTSTPAFGRADRSAP